MTSVALLDAPSLPLRAAPNRIAMKLRTAWGC